MSGSPLDALQTTLAAEHAAVFVYGALGAQTSQSATPQLFDDITDAYHVHQQRRDALIGMIEDAGAEPVAAEAGYDLPEDLSTTAAVTGRALRLEQGAASTYAFLVASTTGRNRSWGVEALVDTAVRELRFGGTPQVLPGL
jgi:hypothetical protein